MAAALTSFHWLAAEVRLVKAAEVPAWQGGWSRSRIDNCLELRGLPCLSPCALRRRIAPSQVAQDASLPATSVPACFLESFSCRSILPPNPYVHPQLWGLPFLIYLHMSGSVESAWRKPRSSTFRLPFQGNPPTLCLPSQPPAEGTGVGCNWK